MQAQCFAALAVCILTFAYLSFCFISKPIIIENADELSSMQDNSIVSVDSIVMHNMSIKCSIDLESVMQNRTFKIIGYKTHYLNRTWVQALKVMYDT